MTGEKKFNLEMASDFDFASIPTKMFGNNPDSWPPMDNAPEYAANTDDMDRIIWKGRQWAVTTYGIECCDGKHYEIEKDNLISGKNYSWIEHMALKDWVDLPDFTAALGVAFLFHLHRGGQTK